MRPRGCRSSSCRFTNLSNNQEDQYLAEAITDDVTTDLSRIPDMIVISRTTAATYAHEAIDIRRIGRELNVRYVLEGSLRRAGRRVRVNIQLIDAERDVHVWAERFDHDTEDLFALQDQITSQIAVALNLELFEAEAARPSDNPDALDYFLRGRAALYNSRGSTREGMAQAVSHFEKALSLDPASIETKAFLAVALAGRVLEQFSETAAEDIGRAEQLIEQVLAASPRHSLAHFAKAQILRAQRQYEAAIPEYEIAIAANRNWVVAIAALGICKFLAGRVEEAIPAQECAIRLSPRDPRLPNWYWRIGMVHLLQSRVDEAIAWLERARSANPRLPGPHAWLASAYALIGDPESSPARNSPRRGGSAAIRRYSSIARFKQRRLLGLAENTFAARRLAGRRLFASPACARRDRQRRRPDSSNAGLIRCGMRQPARSRACRKRRRRPLSSPADNRTAPAEQRRLRGRACTAAVLRTAPSAGRIGAAR